MWCIFKYIVESPDGEHEKSTDTTDKPIVDIGFEEILQTIKNEIDEHAENYIVSLHYFCSSAVMSFMEPMSIGCSALMIVKHRL